MSTLRNWRLDSGITQEQLATECNIPRYKIQLAEQGIAIFRREELAKIQLVLNIRNPEKLSSLIRKDSSDEAPVNKN